MSQSRSARRAAVLSDVHGNAVALDAVLDDVRAAKPDLVVFGGDLTWGPLPERSADPTPRERWLLARHSPAALRFLSGFETRVSVDIEGLGRTSFCHGSPRSDEELVTPATPAARIRAMTAAISERVLVTAHTHLQFDRRVAGVRSINAGSVGMPYEGRPGAYWALLGPDVELRRTEYAVDEAVAAYRASGDPLAEQMVETLEHPPTREELLEHTKGLEFSG